MMRMPRSVAAALVAVGALSLSACTAASASPSPPAGIDLDAFDPSEIPGNGLWLLSGDAAADSVVDAVRAAGSVHYTGTFTELTAGTTEAEPAPGRSLAVDYRGRPGAANARVTAGDLEFEVVVVDGRTYVRGNAAYAERTGLDAVQQGFVCSVGEETLLDEWSPLLRPTDLVASLLESTESLTVEPPDGDATTVSVVVGASEAPVGAMAVARSGPPLPVSFAAGDGSGDGAFSFAEWGGEVDVTAPADPVIDCGS